MRNDDIPYEIRKNIQPELDHIERVVCNTWLRSVRRLTDRPTVEDIELQEMGENMGRNI